MLIRRAVAIAAALAATGSLGTASSAGATFPPSLAGQRMYVFQYYGDNPPPVNGPISWTAACSATQYRAGTIHFRATGALQLDSSGSPFYPGTFREEGMMVMAPQDRVTEEQHLVSYSSTFTIDSPVAQVSGTIELASPDPSMTDGICNTPGQSNAGGYLAYHATITTATATCTDDGISEFGSYFGTTGDGFDHDFLESTQ